MKLTLPSFSLIISFLIFLTPLSSSADERLAPPLSELVKLASKLEGEAVVLRQQRLIKLDKQGNTHKTLYRAIKLNTRNAARDFSQISIGFNSHFSKARLDFARVLTAEGKTLELDKDAVQIQNNAQADFYQDGRNLVFSLPAVTKGAVIEYQIHFEPVRQKVPGELSDGHLFHWPTGSQSEKGYRVDPVAESIVSVSIPAEKNLKFTKLKDGVKYRKSSNNGFTEHRWSYKKLPGLTIERAMPDLLELIPSLEYTTVSSWSEIDKWAFNLVNEKLEADRDIKSIANQIKLNHASKEARIQAVYEYVQENIRYVFAHVDRGGYEPHFASKVLSSQYGDCKDQTILTVSLLNELGIEAYPALISSDESANAKKEIPSLPFDHMITYIPGTNQKEGIWVDTTGEQSLFPGFSTMIEGRRALVINGKGGELISTPVLNAVENSATIDINFVELDNGYPNGSMTFHYSGLYEDYYRSWWINTDAKKAAVAQVISDLYPDAQLTAFNATSPLDLTTPFSVTADFTIDKDWSEQAQVSYAATAIQLVKLYTNLLDLPSPDDRINDFVIFKGVNLNLNVKLDAPVKGAIPVLLNPGLNKKNKWFELKQEGKANAGEYFINISLKIPAAKMNLREYSDFYSYIERMKNEKTWLVFYEKSVPSVAKKSSSSPAGINSGDENMLVQIQRELDEGEYESALLKAKEYVEVNPKSGEGFYLLGLAQGYLDKFNASDRSFAKAKSLGYKF